jgi:hypothetical protein
MERELTLDETVALLKDRNAKAREAITALTAEVAELRKENTRLKSAHDRALFEIRRLEAIIAPIDTTQVTDAKKSAMWETVRTVHGFDVVSEDDENKNRARAYDYVVQRLEGAGIQVRALGRSFGGGELGIEFRGKEATIVAPLTSTSWGLIRIAFLGEEPDPEHLMVKLFFGPRNEYDYEGPHLHSVMGSVGEVIALIQS